jgi:2-phospho-L-lactate guanylyltransferase
MLGHVLEALVHAEVFEAVAVVSPDPDVLAMAGEWGAVGVRQEGRGLNPACDAAARWARGRGADALLLAHADLPNLRADDVRRMVALGERVPIVLAPDRRGTGTNLLLASPPDAIPFAFGVDSRFRHRENARGLEVLEFVSAGTAGDVDTAADLTESLAVEPVGCRA